MKRRIISLLAGLVLLAGQPLLAGSFTYADFSSTAGLTLVGSAAQAGSVIQLTPAALGQAGALWYTAPIPVAFGFTTTFRMQILGDPYWHADGMAFVIQGVGPGAIGTIGGGLGYDGVPNSLAVEFDTWDNGPLAEPPDTLFHSHVAVHSCGTAPNSFVYDLCGLAGASAALEMVPGDFIVTVSYVPGTLTIDSALAHIVLPVDLDSLLSLLPGGRAYIGFTAGTGGAAEVHSLLNWGALWEEPGGVIPEPSTAALLGAGLLALGAIWYRRR